MRETPLFPDFVSELNAFASRHGSPMAGTLIYWATVTLESLHYLADIDLAHAEAAHVPGSQHRPDMIDVAHVRWAREHAIEWGGPLVARS